jgi:hypothetical protein
VTKHGVRPFGWGPLRREPPKNDETKVWDLFRDFWTGNPGLFGFLFGFRARVEKPGGTKNRLDSIELRGEIRSQAEPEPDI